MSYKKPGKLYWPITVDLFNTLNTINPLKNIESMRFIACLFVTFYQQ